jgi:uncharacterized membrane protein YgcG
MTTSTSATPARGGFKGNDSALLGIVLAVVTFWLFAQTTMNIGPLMADDVGMPMPVMNIAISLSALFSGMSRACSSWSSAALATATAGCGSSSSATSSISSARC